MREILDFLMQNKKWWLVPPVIVFLIFGAFIIFAQVSPVGAFIYMLF
jgi:hypothetical protein